MKSPSHRIDRRSFLGSSCAGISAAAVVSVAGRVALGAEQPPAVPPQPPAKTYRAAVVGSTGRGDFGHAIDLALVGLPNVELVAIADDNPAGLEAAGKRCGVRQLYTDYRRMLDAHDIDLVAIGMRHVDRHEALVLHCAQAGKHIYCEKPLAADLASLDRMLAACNKHQVKLAVALPNRASPAIQQAVEMLRGGRLGRLLSLRAGGKSDRRGGGEDLMVLGYHTLDLMCFFAGEPQWTFAQVLQGDADANKSDARQATEPIGPVAGDCVAAMFGFPHQVHGYFQSHRDLDAGSDRFSIEVVGSAGTIAARSLMDVVWFEGPIFNPAKPHRWQPIQIPEWEAVSNKYHWCHQHLMLDLLAAAEQNREPIAGIHHVRWVQEMLQSVYQSHLAQSRVSLPLPPDQRSHPLS